MTESGYLAMSPMANTLPLATPLSLRFSSTSTLLSFSIEMPDSRRRPVAGLTPTPRITKSAGISVPSLRTTAPTSVGVLVDGVKWERAAGRKNLVPLDSWNLRMPFPISEPRIACCALKLAGSSSVSRGRERTSNGAASIPTTVTFARAEAARALSIPIKDEPITTTFFLTASSDPKAAGSRSSAVVQCGGVDQRTSVDETSVLDGAHDEDVLELGAIDGNAVRCRAGGDDELLVRVRLAGRKLDLVGLEVDRDDLLMTG